MKTTSAFQLTLYQLIINYTMSLNVVAIAAKRNKTIQGLEFLLYDMLCERSDRNDCKYFCLST
ncbi:hypothetical protein FM036_07065 [Nostoc sp. HG1]|nr:hypothetical protein [Nostoc sp. HG1]